MSHSWPRIKLGEVLTRSEEAAALAPEQVYQEVTVRLWGKGVVLRRMATGSEMAGTRRFLARKGQLIMSRIDARHGAIGIVPPELDGAVLTNDFPVFNAKDSRLSPDFIGWLCKTPNFVELCKRASEGTTNRVRLQESRFLTLEMSLPPLAEQRRIVVQIKELADKIAEATVLRKQTAKQAVSLTRAVANSDAFAISTPLRKLLKLRVTDVTVRRDETYQFAGVYSFGRGVFRAQARAGADFAYPRLTRLSKGNFVYPKLMAWEGALGVVPAECDGCVVSPEFPVFEVDQSRVYPEVLDAYFRTPSVWEKISGASTGTNVRRRRLHPDAFLDYEMPLPSRPVQEQIRFLQMKIAPLVALQARTQTELNALLPSILDKAFKGEL